MPEPVRFGKYVLTRRLAKGGMATVHLARLPGVDGFEKELVVKQILPELAKDERFVALFVSEAKNAVSLQHGNIVPVYELGIVDGVYFIAMERVRGRTLAELLDVGDPIPPEIAVHVALEVLRALAHAHGRAPPLVHRDLSSRNVMLTYDGEVKVLDFGIAGPAGTTGAEVPLGSFGYLAPEQLQGLPADRRSDLFAVGVLLHEMLTGEPLFAREDSPEMRAEVLRGRSPAPSKVRASSPAELDGPVLAALEREPSKRPSTAEEMMEPLRRWLAARGGLDPADVGRLLRERLPPHIEQEIESLDGTVRLADPAAAARQVTIATSALFSGVEGSLPPPPRMTERDTRVPRAPRRVRLRVVAVSVFLAALLAAVLLAPGTDPRRTSTATPGTAGSVATTPAPATLSPATSLALSTAPLDAGPRVAPPPRPGRVKVLALPWGEITVNDHPYGRAFPAAGVQLAPGPLRIRVIGPHGETAEGSGFVRSGKETVCSTDFSAAPVLYVRCMQQQ